MEEENILEYIENYFKREKFDRLLKFGVNNIDSIIKFSKSKFRIYIVDESRKCILKLKKVAESKGQNNIYVYIDNVDTMNFKYNYFDGVVLINKSIGINELKKYILKAYDILKSDGVLFIELFKIEELEEYLSIFREVQIVSDFKNRESKLLKCIK